MTGINWVLERDKFLSLQEAKTLLETARLRAETAIAQGHKVRVRDYFIVDLALSTGLRVMEIAQLNCGDIFIQDDACSLVVRRGKGGKKRLVRFDESFKQHYKEYIRWKEGWGNLQCRANRCFCQAITEATCARGLSRRLSNELQRRQVCLLTILFTA